MTTPDGRTLSSRQPTVFGESLVENPLVTGGAGAALIAGGCTTLGAALVLSLFMAVCLPLVGMIACREKESISPRRRPAFYVAVTSAAVFLLSIILDNIIPGAVSDVGIYAPLAAMNGLVMHRTWPDARILLPREAAADGLGCALCFALLALPIAFVRELLGGGALLGIPLGLSGSAALQYPFFGFILCGLFMGIFRSLTAGRRVD